LCLIFIARPVHENKNSLNLDSGFLIANFSMWSCHLDNLLEIWGTCSGLEDLIVSLLRTVGSFDFPSHAFAELIDMAVPDQDPG
jgi:hypothetical protein